MQAKTDIPSRFIIHQTRHWVLNHRMNSALPGYLMLSARAPVNSLADLPVEAQAELGILMARAQQVMETQLQPAQLYIGRYGHDAGYAIHFHFIPIYTWVEALFWADERYRALQAFGWVEGAQPQTDGAELTLYVWREFCERPEPPAVQGYSVDETISLLRRAFDPECPAPLPQRSAMYPNKACPVVLSSSLPRKILLFRHPLAGVQLVKGTIENDETPAMAALRELSEESGIAHAKVTKDLGCWDAGHLGQVWSFHLCQVPGALPEHWPHQTQDDHGHLFTFFWAPLDDLPYSDCHPVFQRALAYLCETLESNPRTH